MKFQIRLEKAYAEIEELSKLLQRRDREIGRLKKRFTQKSLQYQVCVADRYDTLECTVEDSAQRAERNNKRKTRQLKNMKDQLNKSEEVNKLQRR